MNDIARVFLLLGKLALLKNYSLFAIKSDNDVSMCDKSLNPFLGKEKINETQKFMTQ